MEFVCKLVNIASRSCYRTASRRPLLVFTIFFLIWIRRLFPVLFTLLVHASPVIASTLILLGTLLFYGHANAPGPQKEGKLHHHEIHNPEIRLMRNAEIGEEKYLLNQMNINDNHKLRSSIDEKLKKDAKSDLRDQKPMVMNFCAQFQPDGDRSGRNSIDPSNDNRVHLYDDNKGWETGSDLAESSSPSASMVDIYSMIDELRPLSESSVPFPHVSTDAASDQSLESGEFVHEADYDDNDQEDTEANDDEDEPVITWTDHSLERNQLFENLVARQKALKNMRMLAEKNMENTNATHISTTRNNPFDLPYHSAMIPRTDPFDFPYDPNPQQPDRVGPAFHMNEPLGPSTLESEPVASDPESTGSNHDLREFIIQRSHDGTVHLQQVAQFDNKINPVKTSGANTGYEEQTSSKSSSSFFFDVTDDIDDDEEEEYRSIDNSEEEEPKDVQIEDSSESSDSSEDTDDGSSEGSSQVQNGLKSWLTGWRA